MAGSRLVLATCVIALAALTGACGGTGLDAPSAPTAPIAPAPSSVPSLMGRWFTGLGVSLRDRESGVEFARYSCGGNFFIRSQNGAEFSGGGNLPGSSPDTDRWCARSASYSGTIDPSGRITLRLDGTTGLPGCTYVSGDSALFHGTFTNEHIVLQSTEFMTCEWPPSYMRPPLSAPLHIYNAERTETLTLTFATPL